MPTRGFLDEEGRFQLLDRNIGVFRAFEHLKLRVRQIFVGVLVVGGGHIRVAGLSVAPYSPSLQMHGASAPL